MEVSKADEFEMIARRMLDARAGKELRVQLSLTKAAVRYAEAARLTRRETLLSQPLASRAF